MMPLSWLKQYWFVLFGAVTFGIFLITAQEVPVGISILFGASIAWIVFSLIRRTGYPQHLLPRDDGRVLALLRIVVSGLLLYQLITIRFLETVRLPESLIFTDTFASLLQSIPFFELVHTNASLAFGLYVLTISFLVASLLGVLTRYSVPIAALLYTITYGMALQYYNLWHEGLLALSLLYVLAFFPSGDRYSFDALFVNRTSTDGRSYGFALLCVWLVVGLTYASLGASKLLHSGFGWLHPDVVRGHILSAGFIDIADPVSRFVLQGPGWVFVLLGATTLIMQLGYLTTLFSHRARIMFPLLAIAFSLSVMHSMHIYFYDLILVNAVLFYSALAALRAASAHRTTHMSFSFVGRRAYLPFVIITVYLSVWHGYIEDFPFTSWDMYSGRSQFVETSYLEDRTITRFHLIAHFRDGSEQHINVITPLNIYTYPGKCGYRYKQHHHTACMTFYEYLGDTLFARGIFGIDHFEARYTTLYHDAKTDTFVERGVKKIMFGYAR